MNIPNQVSKARVGYSLEAIVKVLDGVANTQVDQMGTTKPLLECITSVSSGALWPWSAATTPRCARTTPTLS